MRKIVSKKDGNTYYYEIKNGKMKCIKFETGKHMSGSEIAGKLNISRAAVSQRLQRSMGTIYVSLKRKYDCSSIQVASAMAKVFNISTEKEYKKFFRLFPDDIKGEINEEARNLGYYR